MKDQWMPASANTDSAALRLAARRAFTGLPAVWGIIVFLLGSSLWAAQGESQPTEEVLKKLSIEELAQVKITTQSTVSRIDERVDDTPGSVYVYTREMIQERGYRSLGELLQTVPGFTVFHRDLQFVTGVRGLNANDNEKTTLLINGQNLNQTHEPDFLNGPINLDNVERVEVVVGPSAFFQQANTLAATINVITRDVDGVEAIAAAGNYLKYDATLMTGTHWEKDKFVSFSFSTEAKRGFDAWDQNNRPTLAGKSQTGELDWPSFFGVLKGQYGEVSAQATAYRDVWPELNINNGGRENNGQYIDQFYSLLVKDEHKWTDTFTSFITAEATLKELTRLNRGGVPVNAAEISDKQWYYSSEIGARYTGFEHHFIQAGVQGNYEDNFQNWFTFNVTSPPEHIDRTPMFNRDTDAIGFYLDDTYQPASWLKLVGGIRDDHNTKIPGDRWFPGARADAILNPTSNWVSKLMFNRAVRMPSAYAALNYVWGAQNSDDPHDPSFARVSVPPKRPETLETFEWLNIVYLAPVRLSLSVYHEEIQGFISWFEPSTNIGNFRGNGAELTLEAKLNPKLTLWGNTAYNRSELDPFKSASLTVSQLERHVVFDPNTHRLVDAPMVTANMGVHWEIVPNLIFSPTLRYFTQQPAHDNETDSFFLIRNRYYLDATLLWRNVWGKNLDIRLSGNNLLNNRKHIPGQWSLDLYRPQGIAVVLGVDYRF